MSFAVGLKTTWSCLKSRALDFIMSYSASLIFSWVNHFFCVLFFPVHEMTFAARHEVSGFPVQYNAALLDQQVELSNIDSWLPVNGMWGLETSTAGEYHTQLYNSCSILLEPVTRSLHQVFISGVRSCQHLQIKTCSPNSFIWMKKKKRGKYLLTGFLFK